MTIDFACFTSPVINAATELVLPIVMRWYAEWKAGDHDKDKKPKADLDEKRSTDVELVDEASFLQSVERQALLPEYSLFGTSEPCEIFDPVGR